MAESTDLMGDSRPDGIRRRFSRTHALTTHRSTILSFISTFMRRVTGIFGGDPKPPAGGNPDSNTLISEMTTVICLDDYHSLDREGRKVAKVCLV